MDLIQTCPKKYMWSPPYKYRFIITLGYVQYAYNIILKEKV